MSPRAEAGGERHARHLLASCRGCASASPTRSPRPIDDQSVKLRASIPVTLTITGTAGRRRRPTSRPTVARNVDLYGPGDVVGIDPRAIVKLEPRHWITNFEPNYLPYIEFYEEDFPWRYTPAAPDATQPPPAAVDRARRAEGGRVQGSRRSRRRGRCPRSRSRRSPTRCFPPADQLWAWAHVHVNRDLIEQDGVFTSTDIDAIARAARGPAHGAIRTTPTRGCCARGRSSRTPATTPSSFRASRAAGWRARPRRADVERRRSSRRCRPGPTTPAGRSPTLHPVYHALVLQDRHGRRLRVSRPAAASRVRPTRGSAGATWTRRSRARTYAGIAEPELKGVLRLGGALKVPDEALDRRAGGRGRRATRTGISPIRTRSRQTSRASSI